MRVIVAGTKSWPYASVVRQALDVCALQARRDRARLTVVHGHPGSRRTPESTADMWADAKYRAEQAAHATKARVVDPPERHPPDWFGACRSTCTKGHRKTVEGKKTTCPMAGFYRIDDMVNRGADLALIFVGDREPLVWLDYLTGRLTTHHISIQEFRP